MVPYEFDAERFSRWMAYVLRHNPGRYGLQPDRHGYIDLAAFLLIAQRRYPALTPEQVRGLVDTSSSRFEIAGSRLRARYGHSIDVEPPGPAVEPPAHLYHGTEAAHLPAILQRGLLPVDRRMIHLSETIEDALSVARRKTDQPAVLRILAHQAYAQGISFYREGKVFLAREIPPAFLAPEEVPVR